MAERTLVLDRPAAAHAAPAEDELANLKLFARSIAHDFNNLLSGILGHAMLIEELRSTDPDIADSASVIRKTAERAAELNEQLINLARMGAAKAEPVDLHSTIREVADLLSPSLGRAINPELDLAAAQPVITGDPGQIHQVLLNLAINARDAMPRGGRMLFSTESAHGMLTVRLTDTGQGIPLALHERIFEPLFTTKGVGRGSGLGLAVVKRVVQQHSGLIEMKSAPGQGTTFTLRFPLREEAAAAAATAGLRALSAVAGS